MSRSVLAAVSLLALGMFGACWRKHVSVTVMEIKRDATPKPITATAVQPPTPVPVQLGVPPRLKEEPR